MPHTLIIGMTESGKTTLAKQLASGYKKRGFSVLVFDPIFDKGWEADFKTDNEAEFLAIYWASKNCAVFIDESADSVGKHNTEMIKTATSGRHCGHNNHYITQRGASVNKTVRDQCRSVFLFTSSIDDCKVYAREFNAPKLMKGVDLAQGHYYMVRRFGTKTGDDRVQTGKVF